MASTSKKWFIGCGIGCGLMILIIAGIGGGIYFAVKDVVGDAESIDESFEALESTFGSPYDFTPSINGAISPDRMEVFLAARDAMAESQNKMADLLETLDHDKDQKGEDGKSKVGVLAKIKAGVALVPATMGFISERNQFLLEKGMGTGEYTYIYSLAYFGFLKKELADGPSFKMTGKQGDDDEDNKVSWNIEAGKDETKVRKNREKEIRRRLHPLQMSFLQNQIAALDEAGPGNEDLRQALEAERDAMNSSTRRLLWEEGLPEVIAASFAPFEDRLQESYSPILNVMEVTLTGNE